MALFESYERRIDKINAVLNSYGISSIEEAEKITKDAGLNVYDQIKGIQPICFENACWAYIVGAAIAIKKNCRKASEAAAAIGEGLQAFCIPGSVADQKEVFRKAYSDGPRAKVNCYGANDVREGVAIMWKENVDVSITGNSTNPTRFQHPVAGTYKKERIEAGKKYFSVASGGGTGRTLHPDNMAAGPASYGMTDTLGRMHSDAQFAGSSSVPAHVEMMGLIGAGNNPMVGMTVAVAVSIEEAASQGKF